VFFFTPAGVVGIVLSVMASRRATAGDREGAIRASRMAKTSCWVSVILGLVLYLLLAVGAVRLPGST
jgi:Na+-driven multidrug efflux pump